MKTLKFLTVAVLVALSFSGISCSSDDGEPTQAFAFSLTKQGQPFSFNHKLGIANPKTLSISLSKLSSLRTTPANLTTQPIQGCGTALNENITNDVHIALMFTEVSLNTNLYLTDGVYQSPDYNSNNNTKMVNLFITQNTGGAIPLNNVSGSLTITKNSTNTSVNIKGTVTLSNNETLSFPTEGLDVPFSMCQ